MTVDPILFDMMRDEISIEPFAGNDRANIQQYDAAQTFLGKLTVAETSLPSNASDDKRASVARFTMRDYVDVDTRSRVTFPNEEIDNPRIISVQKHTGTAGEQSHTVLFF